jgi:hypothetical protein
MENEYQVIRHPKYQFNPKYVVVNGEQRKASELHRNRADAEAVAAQLNAGTLEPTIGDVVTAPTITSDDLFDSEVLPEGIAGNGYTMYRSRIGGGYDTQIWDQS